MTFGRPCLTCTHPLVKAIDGELQAGLSAQKVADKYGISRDSVARHRRAGHILVVAPPQAPKSVAVPTEDAESVTPSSALERLQALIVYLDGQETAGLGTTALVNLSKEKRLAYESLAKMQGPLAPPEWNPAESAEWTEARNLILDALGPFPDAYAAVLQAIEDVEARHADPAA